MIAISAALALGPAMDAARSPERRVKVKLTTRTVRHTRAASANLRKINDCIADTYDGEGVTASSRQNHCNGDTETACLYCICSQHARQYAQAFGSDLAFGRPDPPGH